MLYSALMNIRAFYALIFFGACAFATLYQVNNLKANAEDLNDPLTSPITSPITPDPIVPPVINNPSNNNNNDNNSGSNNSGGNNNGSSSCSNDAPKLAPHITRATTSGKNQITLFYTKPEGQISSYSVVYGTKSGVYRYGLSGINGTQNSVVINGLTRGATYFFKIQGVNGCAAGPFSHEIKIKVGSNSYSQVFAAKNVQKNFKPTGTTQKIKMPAVYNFKPAPFKYEGFIKTLLSIFN